MDWTPAQYKEAEEHLSTLDPDAPGYKELNSAILNYEDMHQNATEVRGGGVAPGNALLDPYQGQPGAGFISQQFPSLAHDPTQETPAVGSLVPQERLPPNVEGQRAIAVAQASKPQPPPAEHIVPGMGMRAYLPAFLGGGTEYWDEPTLLDFHQATGAKDKERDSPEYQAFADEQWAKRYAIAAQNGENVIRTEKTLPTETGPFIAKKAAEAVHGLPTALLGGAVGLADMATARTLLNADQRRYVQDEAPIGFGVGSLFGAAEGVPEAALERGAEITGLKSALRASEPAIARTALRGAGAGAIGAGATEAIAQLDAAAKGEKTGDPEKEMIRSALFGAGGGTLAGAGAALATGLRGGGERGRQLRIIEKSLGGPATKMNPLSPLEVPPAVESAILESMGAGDNQNAVAADILANRAAPDITRRALAEDVALEREIKAQDQAFYATKAGAQMIPPKEIAGTLVALGRRRSFSPELPPEPVPIFGKPSPNEAATRPDALVGTMPNEGGAPRGGGPLPGVQPAVVRQMANRALEAIPALPGGTAARVIAEREGGIVCTIEDAENLGLQLDLPPLSPTQRAMTEVVIRPRPMNASQYDEATRAVDRLARAATKQGASDPALTELQAAIRRDRSKFGWNADVMGPKPGVQVDDKKLTGWAALKELQHEKLSNLEQRKLSAGIPAGDNVTPEQAQLGVERAARGFRQPGHLDVDRALMSFAAKPSGLFDIPAAGAVEALGKGPEAGTRASVFRSSRLAIDPVTRFFQTYGMPIGTAVGSGNLKPGAKATLRDVPLTFTEVMRLLQENPQ